MSLCTRCKKAQADKSWCQSCHRSYSKERRDKLRGGAGRPRRSGGEIKSALEKGVKFCPGCRKIHPLDCYSADRTRPDGRKTKCKLCYTA